MKIVLEDDEAIAYLMDKVNAVSQGALAKADIEIADLKQQLQTALALKSVKKKKK